MKKGPFCASFIFPTCPKPLPLKENLVLTRGAEIKTGNDTTVDIILQYNGTVLRLLGNSTLSFDKLNKENAGEEVITETSLNLKSGCILGSQRKLAVPSSFEVNTPRGIVTIKGTEYVVRSDGAVGVLSGSVQVIYNPPVNDGPGTGPGNPGNRGGHGGNPHNP